MSLRILFADDSVTAQNMGKKILTEAGYEVVAVSNGAAAVKKIAEQKPDIIILDVYMPGYSGLEVCEKVRSSAATTKTPVLLTVGKMEPYKQEDANRVRADGVIIKPFEASDLLAIVKKFEDRIAETPAAPPTSAFVTAMPQVGIAAETAVEVPEPSAPARQHFTLDVPDHMATASAFGDMLGSEPGHVQDNFSAPIPSAAAELKPPVEIAKAAAAVPDYEIPVSWKPEPAAHASVAADTPQPEAVRPPQIPIYRESNTAEVEAFSTTADSIGDVEIPQDPTLQRTDAEATRNTVAEVREPDLVPTMQETSVHTEEPGLPELVTESFAVNAEAVSTPELVQETVPVAAPTPINSDMDFEARVAAAMSAYTQAPEMTTPQVPVAQQAPAIEELAASAPPDTVEIEALSDPPANVAQEMTSENMTPLQESPSPVIEAPVAELKASQWGSQLSSSPEPEFSTNHNAVTATLEAAIPAAAAAAASETGAEHHTIAQAVHRVMERMKGDLVEEIVRELNSRK